MGTPHDPMTWPSMPAHFSRAALGQCVDDATDDQTVRIPIVPRYLANDGISSPRCRGCRRRHHLAAHVRNHSGTADGRLVRLLEDWTIGSVPIHAVFPANKHIASKVRRFTDFLIKRLPKDALAL